jgi:hypothetical protein
MYVTCNSNSDVGVIMLIPALIGTTKYGKEKALAIEWFFWDF